MSTLYERVAVPDHFRVNIRPIAANEAVIQFDKARFTLLTDRLIRLEYHPAGDFEDRASQAFWYREQPVPEFSSSINDNRLEIETAYLRLIYEGGEFTPETLSITLKASGVIWHPGDPAVDNLLGTTRTLDFMNGYARLEKGLISRAGWSVLDDSKTLVFNDDHWIEPRAGEGIDWYFFGYGHDYKTCLRDYCQISGQIPMIPRWILGNWWSRYWAYTQDEYTQLINDFETYQLPFSVCIIDMDWHVTETGNASTGWTGYTWNRKLFPDPAGFIQFLHDKGLKTALNLHPAEGIHCHEEHYPTMAQRLGIDPESKEPIKFNIENLDFARAYFEVLHHPYEAMGIDFWWIDWQQGLSCDLPGLDPLWLINHLHFHDLGRDGTRRPFIFSRWGNEGHQRYPIGFSGDTYRTWESLKFESYMTATAANIAYGWWSHDIGGHTGGVADSELFTRWVQFGVFSPINRLHVGKGDFYDQRPWMFDNAEVLKVLREALQLRHALIPYLYTMAYRAHLESQQLAQPMYYDYPEQEEAYHCPHQYLFGTELIAAPFVTPADPDTQLSRQVVWLPAGDWYHFLTGEYYPGNGWHAIYGRLQDIPLFARAGAILPMAPHVGWDGIDNPAELVVHVFAGADHSFTLYEDDGETLDHKAGHFCLTTFSQRWYANRLEFTITSPTGDTSCIPGKRHYHLLIHGVSASTDLSVEIDGQPIPVTRHYDPQIETLHLSGIAMDSTSSLRVVGNAELARRNRKRETVLSNLRFFKLHTGVRNRIAGDIDAILTDPEKLAPYLIALTQSQGQMLFEILYEAGVDYHQDTHQPLEVIFWNNRASDQITYRYSDAYLFFGFLRDANHSQSVVPRFATFAPPVNVWRHGAYEENVHPPHWHAQVDYFNLFTVAQERRYPTP